MSDKDCGRASYRPGLDEKQVLALYYLSTSYIFLHIPQSFMSWLVCPPLLTYIRLLSADFREKPPGKALQSSLLCAFLPLSFFIYS